MRASLFFLTVFISSLALPLQSLALSSDKDQPINIEADQLEIDDSRHISIYRGNVDMRQGSLHIRADRIDFFFTADNDLIRLEIQGEPATFKQLNDKQQPMQGSALNMVYFENESLLKLNGQARFQSNEDTIESETITINTESNALEAGNGEKKGRVRMLIQPQNNNKQ